MGNTRPITQRVIPAAVVTTGLVVPLPTLLFCVAPARFGLLFVISLLILLVLLGAQSTALVAWSRREQARVNRPVLRGLPPAPAQRERVRPCPCCGGNRHGWQRAA